MIGVDLRHEGLDCRDLARPQRPQRVHLSVSGRHNLGADLSRQGGAYLIKVLNSARLIDGISAKHDHIRAGARHRFGRFQALGVALAPFALSSMRR